MAKITFIEKTGCINNTKQKKILELAGHEVKAINLLKHDWTEDELLLFFGKLEVKEWFNKNAPKVQSGEVAPEKFSRTEAIQALIEEPILIRRPLLIIGNQAIVGFDTSFLQELIGLKAPENSEFKVLITQNLNHCPQKSKNLSCD